MQTDSSIATPASAGRLIAAPWHTVSMLLMLGFFAVLDAWSAMVPHGEVAMASQGSNARAYLLPIAYEWGIACWAWAGVRMEGGALRDLTGVRWESWRSFALDVAVAVPFWGLWELAARLGFFVFNRVQAPGAVYQPPSGFVEVFVWIVLSVSAGICEEIVYRGYLQRQFRTATRSIVAAVILQAVVFGSVHVYQGWKHVLVIVPLGILYGALVAWRGNLRASMMAHTWSDIFEGWLRFV